MIVKTFVDTSLLLYAHSSTGEKGKVAQACLRELWEKESGVVSTQVLAEFYVNLTRKWSPAVTPDTALELTAHYAAWPVVVLESPDVLQACRLEQASKLSFWDALIVVAAAKAGAERLLTEDLNHGQTIAGVRVVNPLLYA